MGTLDPKTGTPTIVQKATQRIKREIGYAAKAALFYIRLRALDRNEGFTARIAAGGPLEPSMVLSALEGMGITPRANRRPQDVEPDDIWDMEADEYEKYLRRREGLD